MKPARRRRGSVLLYTLFAMAVLIVMTMVAVDFGRNQLVKTELRAGVDACARFAVKGASDGTALDKANWLGAQNKALETALTFVAADVETGSWNKANKTFTPGGLPRTAVRLTARRTIPTVFGGALGVGSSNVTVQAVVVANGQGYGLIGLNSISMSGNSTASYNSAVSGTPTDQGNIASNGDITLNGSSKVNGNAYAGVGKSVTGGYVTGTRGQVSAPLAFPSGNAEPYKNDNDNSALPNSMYQNGLRNFTMGNNQNATVPGGTYVLSNVSIAAGAELTFSGPTTIYCYGTFSMSGHATTSGNLPGNLTIIMCPNPNGGSLPGALNIGGDQALYANIYAPQSAVTLGGTGDIYGSVLGLTVSMTGTSEINYDTSLDPNAGAIVLVQ